MIGAATQTVRAPAKLILTGEHAVLQGAPILVSAVDRYMWTTVAKRSIPDVVFQMRDLAYTAHFPWKALRKIQNKLQSHYADFLAGKRPIRQVLESPAELIQYVVAHVGEGFRLPPWGLEITTQSTIPVGSGMGSSAAAIVSTLCAIFRLFHLPWEPAHVIRMGQIIENLQHGRSSGMDLRAAVLGGLWWGTREHMVAVPVADPACLEFPVWFTGSPSHTTGECVQHTQPILERSPGLVADCVQIADQIHQGLMGGCLSQLQAAVRENHRILVSLGVVPEPVQSAIAALEKRGWAGKICGAGSLHGPGAGPVWVVCAPEERPAVAALGASYGWPMWTLQAAQTGVEWVDRVPDPIPVLPASGTVSDVCAVSV